MIRRSACGWRKNWPTTKADRMLTHSGGCWMCSNCRLAASSSQVGSYCLGCSANLTMGRLLGVLFLLACSAHAETFEGKVARIVDGDSLIVRYQQQNIRVRLKEIDAPERKQPFGKQSQSSLTALCANKVAHVEWTEKD